MGSIEVMSLHVHKVPLQLFTLVCSNQSLMQNFSENFGNRSDRAEMAAPRPLFPHDPGSYGPGYVVLGKTCNHNQVSVACSSECVLRFDGEDHVTGESSVDSEDREVLMETVPESSKLGFWFNPWEWYQNCLLKRPLCTQMVTSGVLWSLGDLIAQILIMAMSNQASVVNVGTVNPNSTAGGPASFPVEDDLTSNDDSLINWRRVAASGSFGGAFVGPTGHYWYQFLEYVCTTKLKLEPNSGRFVGAKLSADTLLFGPLHLLVFFFYMSLAAGKTFLQFEQDLHRDYFPTLLSEGVLWTCVQVVNFRYVPVKHQLLFVNCIALVDSAFLSWIKHSDNVPWKSWTTKTK